MTTISTAVSTERIASVTLVQTTSQDAWRAAVTLRGELDSAVADAVLAELRGHLAAGRAVIRVDAAGVTFIDSTVLSTLVTAHRECRDAHATMIISGPSRPVLRLLTLTGLDAVLLVDTALGDVAADSADAAPVP
jgi:anti-sigma B factor antagonist